MNGVLEVVIGLVFVFVIFSSITSATVEWISAYRERRSRTLRDSLDRTLGTALADELLAHPVIDGLVLSSGAPGVRPSYLSPKAVALALAEIAQQHGGPTSLAGSPLPAVLARKRLARLVDTFGGSQGSQQELLFRLEQWFTEQMERTSGLYKRWTQLGTIAVAVLLTGAFDLDSGRIVSELNRNAVLRTAVADHVSSEIAGKTLASLDTSVRNLGDLPIGWKGRPRDVFAQRSLLGAILGWLVSIVAIGLGAPFWFDLLNRLVNLRQTGARPSSQVVAQ